MPRLNATDVARLVSALHEEMPGAPTVERAVAPPDEAAADGDRAQSKDPRSAPRATQQVARPDPNSVAAAIRGALHSYFGREIILEIQDEPHLPANPLRFEAGESTAWHLDLDAPLAAALVDLAIGGDGSNIRHPKRNRIGRMLEPLARELLRAVAAVHGAEEPPAARFIETARRHATPITGGTMQVGNVGASWSAGVAHRDARAPSRAPIAQTPSAVPFTSQAQAPPARDIVYVTPEPVKSPQPPTYAREPVLPPRGRHDEDNPFAAAVEAAGARLGDTARCPTELDPIEIARVDTPALQRGDLKLALIAGGQGSLVLSADRETVVCVASAAIGIEPAAGTEPGSVSLDAVEAVLRAAMRAFADKLPAIAGTPSRFVRLADSALPARSPHFKIVAPLRIGERAATLRWLVPTWMAGASGDARAPIDAS